MRGYDKKAKKPAKGFTEEEKEAMKERAQELLGHQGRGEAAVLASIAKMPQPDRAMAERIHTIIKEAAPTLMPKTWYGMPAYANSEGKVVCFFQAAYKFKYRYATLGFSDVARLDEGAMWPTTYAITELTTAVEARVTSLVAQAVST